MVRRNIQQVSDERVRLATGRGRDHWFELLDASGAAEWKHPKIASFLKEQGIADWWCQGITVAYEQSRGLRLPGQRPDGTFDANASKTLPTTLTDAWHFLYDDAERAAWLGEEWPVTGATEGKSIRIAGPDDTKVTVNFFVASKVEATPKLRVQVQHSKLESQERAEEAKRFWQEALTRLGEVIAGA